MKRIILSLFAVGVLGVAVGFALGIFVYPFWFLTDVAMEQVSNREARTVVATGEFIHANPSDPVHWGTGGVTIFQDPPSGGLLHLEADFEVGPGPRFHVYLVDRDKVLNNADFKESEMVDLGRLKAFKGSQSYAIPASVELAKYKSVVIWCKEFGVLISPAMLASSSAAPATS